MMPMGTLFLTAVPFVMPIVKLIQVIESFVPVIGTNNRNAADAFCSKSVSANVHATNVTFYSQQLLAIGMK